MNSDRLLDLLKTRRSIREFLPSEIPDDDLLKMIEAASWAPSGTNRQNWHFIAVRSASVKERMASAVRAKVSEIIEAIPSDQERKTYQAYSEFLHFFKDAPLAIAVVKKPYRSTAREILRRHGLQSGNTSSAEIQGPAAAIQNLLLMAHALGYGACWMTGPLVARGELEELLGIGAPDELLALLPVGRYDKQALPPARKRREEILSFR